MRLVPAAIAAALVVAPATLPLAAQAPRQYRLSGNSVAVYNLVGSMQLEAGSGGDVQVEVRAAGADAAKLTVQQGEIAGRNTLRVIYPDDRITYRSRHWDGQTTLRVRDDGTFDDDEHGERGRHVTIESRGEGLDASADLRILVPAGRTLAVHLAVGDVRATNVDGRITLSTSSADVTVKGSRGALGVDVGSGDVDVTDNRGDLDIDTGSGDVTLTRVAGKRLTVDAGSGTVRGSDITADVVSLDLGSGGATLANVHSSDITLDTGSGDVDLGLAGNVRSLVVDSGSGDVTIRVPASLGATLDVDAGSGGVSSEIPLTITHKDGSELSGTIGDGNGRIKIDSGSGRVRLRKA